MPPGVQCASGSRRQATRKRLFLFVASIYHAYSSLHGDIAWQCQCLLPRNLYIQWTSSGAAPGPQWLAKTKAMATKRVCVVGSRGKKSGCCHQGPLWLCRDRPSAPGTSIDSPVPPTTSAHTPSRGPLRARAPTPFPFPPSRLIPPRIACPPCSTAVSPPPPPPPSLSSYTYIYVHNCRDSHSPRPGKVQSAINETPPTLSPSSA